MVTPKRSLAFLPLAGALLVLAVSLPAQEAKVLTGEAKDVPLGGEGGAPAVAQPVPVKPEGAPGKATVGPGKPGEKPGKPGEGPGKPDAKKAKPGEAKPKEIPPVQRPTKPPKPPDPEELKARPDQDGRVSFHFKGQPWPPVLEWLAEISGMSLDWQELPGDYLNLVTQRSYTVKEARDLINRHLLARGYTLLAQGEVLSVVNLKKLNPAMVPRVEPEELAGREPYEFVKVSFALDWLVADSAVEELKPMLSPQGKLIPLRATNRIEAMDAVVNLREIHAVLAAEQSPQSQERLVREFVLRYARAADVHEQLRAILGLKAKAPGPSGPTPQDQQAQQARMAMMAGGHVVVQGSPGREQPGQKQPGGAAPKARQEVSLTVNSRRNSILAAAPPDKMAMITQAVKVLDVPSGQDSTLLGAVNRVQVYRLAAIDPEPLVKTLEELGNLSPSTRLEVDKKHRAIIAYAPLADHVIIRSLVERLDASERKFEVLQLRRLEADYVAGTIESMIVGEKPKKSRRSRFSYGFDPYGGSRGQEQDSASGFRVDADVEYNRILLWANSVELQEVHSLLVKLGEIPPEGGNPSTVRVLNLPPGKETDALLEEVRRKWPLIAPNKLVLPPPEKATEGGADRGADRGADEPQEGADQRRGQRGPGQESAPRRPAADSVSTSQLAAAVPSASQEGQLGGKENGPRPSGAAAAPVERPGAAGAAAPPVTITRGPGGEWIVTSPDTEALDRLEELIARSAATSPGSFQIFRLKYAWASTVASILKDVFKVREKQTRGYPWWWDDYGREDDSDEDRVRLSKRRPVKIISDIDTNSILVMGADAGQLKRMDELIAFYDQPEPTDARSARRTETFKIRYSKAGVIAETIKEVYRDLLSANDKALISPQQQQQPRSQRYSGYAFAQESETGAARMPTFKGLISIGVDELSNTLVVSAPEYLMESITKIVKELDEAAPAEREVLTVLKIGPGASAATIRSTLSRALSHGNGRASGGRQPGQAPAPVRQGQGNRRPAPAGQGSSP